ncbi:MAG: HDIG domain-containing protein [Candidatus Brocadiaceae bacterium]|nr:HDIG domain-containing protein [Candidatus Brocadiaceae bacterium]
MADWPARDEALSVLHEWTENKNLRKHAYAVEAAMRAYARRLGEDEDRWGVLGLLHDFDYERYPDAADHPARGAEYLRAQGYSEELAEGVMAHAEHTGTSRDTAMKRAVFAVDELTGLIVAVALVRPSRKLSDVTVDAVMKKWPEKRFAAGVDRSLVETGAREMGVSLEEHIGIVLEAMQEIAEDLGL